MEFRTLRVFTEVVRQGGFSQAARVLNSTQSTVSKAVKQLEDELGETLLDRDAQGNKLTGAGEIVFRHARAMLLERDDLIRELDEVRWLKRGALRLGIPTLASSILIAPTFAAYRRQFPGIDIAISECDTRRLEDMLREGDLDLAALLVPVGADFEWDEQDIVSVRIVALLPNNHPLAGRNTIEPDEVADMPLLLLAEESLRSAILSAAAKAGHRPKVAASIGQVHFLAKLVEEGLGVAFVPEQSAQLVKNSAVRSVLVDHADVNWRLVFASRKGGYLSHAARAWLALARESQGRAAPAAAVLKPI